jgi:hypothetical protein
MTSLARDQGGISEMRQRSARTALAFGDCVYVVRGGGLITARADSPRADYRCKCQTDR